MTYEMRALSETELDVVAGGNPAAVGAGAFALGAIAGAAAGALIIGVAVGVKLYNDDKEANSGGSTTDSTNSDDPGGETSPSDGGQPR